jgi:hypothetical protein
MLYLNVYLPEINFTSPFSLDPFCYCPQHQADIARLLIGQPDYKFLTHSRTNSGKGKFKKGTAFSLNTTVICCIKCQWTGYMFTFVQSSSGKFIIKKEMFSKQVLVILPWDQ